MYLYPCNSCLSVSCSVGEPVENPYENKVRGSDLNQEKHEKSMLIVCSSLRKFRMDPYLGFSLLILSVLALVSLLRLWIFLDCAYFHVSGSVGI